MLRNCKHINQKKYDAVFGQIKKVAYEKRLCQFIDENLRIISK